MLESHPAEGETPAFKGSMLVAAGQSIDQVKEMLARDVYTTSGVWDLENATIVPVCFTFLLSFGFVCLVAYAGIV